MRTLLGLLVTLAAGASIASQRTFVVDANGGGQFTDLPPAVAVAADGDILEVRPGSYTGVVIVGKGLRILGEPGVEVSAAGLLAAAFRIESLPVGSEMVFSGLAAARGASFLFARDCLGSLNLSGVTVAAGPEAAAAFVRCRQASVQASTLAASLSIAQSNVALSASEVVGTVLGSGAALPAIEVFAESGDGSLLSVSHVRVAGRTGAQRGAPAVFVYSPLASRIVLAGAGTVLAAGSGAHVIEASIRTVVEHSPTVAFVPSGSVPVFGGQAWPRERPLSSVRVDVAPPGNGVIVELEARGGDVMAAFAALPGVPAAAPIRDSGWVWLDDMSVHEFLTMPSSGVVRRAYRVDDRSLRGRAITIQALSGTVMPFDVVMGVPATFVLN